MRIDADRERCTGAGMCALTAPDVFDQNDEDGRVVVLTERPASKDRHAVQRAVTLCPSGALSLHEVSDLTVPKETA
jgi:ferredoxin